MKCLKKRYYVLYVLSNIIIQKGYGFNIIGNDDIALIYNNCKKVYGFSDVKYKDNCHREL